MQRFRPTKSSHTRPAMAHAAGLVVLPAAAGVPAGDRVELLLLRAPRAAPAA